MRIRPIIVTSEAPFFGEPCALCGELFQVDDIVVRCPVDRVTHHTDCWEANRNECVALGCAGRGRIIGAPKAYNPQNRLEREEAPIRVVEGEILEAAEAQEERVGQYFSSKRRLRLRSCLIWAIILTLISCGFVCTILYTTGSFLLEEAGNFINQISTTPMP